MGSDQVLLMCGHTFCYECIQFMIERVPNKNTVQCPICRRTVNIEEISYVSADVADPLDKNAPKVKGSYGTKIEAVVGALLQIHKNNKEDKVIVFSQWNDVLEIISRALVENGVTFTRGDKGAVAFQEAVARFRKEEGIQVLLLPIKKGANGLNIIEATHVFIVEPLLNHGVEAQAVNRIHRFGQEKECFIHRFIIKNTIEERVAQMGRIKTEEVDNWRMAKERDSDLLTKTDLEFLMD
eukprot:gene6556-7600_t